VLVAGAKAPRLVTEAAVARMKPGAVIVDVAVDQGGCVETIRPTTLADPVYTLHDVLHYGVTNMPALVPRTSTFALTNATLPYAVALADHGVADAIRRDPGLRLGVNVAAGKVTHPAVAEGVGAEYVSVEEALGQGTRNEERVTRS
jgi:alanine dehydrogenase